MGKQSRGVLTSSAAYDYTLDEQEVKFDSYGYFSLVVTNGDGKTETLKCLTYTTLTPKIMNSVEKMNNNASSQQIFYLNAEDWEKFNEMLDAPPKDVPGLRKLMDQPDVFSK